MKKWWNTKWATRENFENFIIYVVETYTWSYFFKKLNPITNMKILMNFLKLSVMNMLYSLFKLSDKDYLWEHAKSRFFLVKFQYFLMLMFFFYISVSYMYDSFLMSDWQCNDTGDLWFISKSELDFRVYLMYVPPKVHTDQEDPMYYEFLGDRFKLSYWVDMWLHLMVVSFMLSFIFFLAIFLSKMHECVYNKRIAFVAISSIFCFVHSLDEYLMITSSYYIILFSYLPYYVFYIVNKIYWTILGAVYEDPDDYADNWMLNYVFRIPPPPQLDDWLVLPDMAPYDGGLHTVPNMYSLDPDFEAKQLIEESKQRYFDVVEGGTLYEMYHMNYVSMHWDLNIMENIVVNFMKVFSYNWYGMATVFSGWAETLSEFLHSYYKGMEVLGKKDYGFNAMDYMVKSPYEEIMLDAWYEYELSDPDQFSTLDVSKKYFDDISTGEIKMLNSDKWYLSFPMLLRWCYLLYWFYQEYTLGLDYVAYVKKRRKRKYMNIWPSFKRFFGFNMSQEPKVFKFSEGYILYDILPHVFLKDHKDFDWEMYNAPTIEYDSVKDQIRKLLLKSYNNITYFILNFFGSSEFWISILQIWSKDSISSAFLYWLFIRIFNLCINMGMFMMLFPYSVYKIIIFIHSFFFSMLWLFYYLQIIYWSFLLNCVYGIKLTFLVMFEKIKVVGRFKYFNCSPWKNYSVEKFWQNFFLLFKSRIPKSFKLNPRSSFLVWSSKWK